MNTPFRENRGSVILVAMIFSLAIAFAISSYMSIAIQSVKNSNRSVHGVSALNIAETGLEEGLWNINAKITGNASFDASVWTVSGLDAVGSFNISNLGQNTSGVTKVYVKNYDGVVAAPTVVAHSIVSLPGQNPVEKWVEVQLQKRSYFATGLVAKESITFNGNNATVDSWNSAGTGGAIVGYSSTVAHDKGSIGSVLVDSTIAVNNADIWGFASVGGTSSSAISVGPNGRVGPYGTGAGVKDPTHVSTDFTANLDPYPMTYTGTTISAITTNTTLGVAGSTTPVTYQVPSISLINKTLTIVGPVVLEITASAGSSAITVGGGSGAINVVNNGTAAMNGSLIIKTAGDIKIAGNGVSNGGLDSSGSYVNGQPINLQIYGTATASSLTLQDIDIKGNGTLSAACYAPFSNLTISGGGTASSGDVYGSFVADKVLVSGNVAFHYDESLSNFGSNSYGITEWRELVTATDRAVYSSKI